ncbi:MAG: oligoribonuclease [Oligoflexia bacterium]|nr:oligoribonuclease [Oligoflexia bacterium]
MKLLWLDMEMSGLDVEKCRPLEIAAIITDETFKEIAEYHSVIFQEQEVLSAMDEWCTKQHGDSGLTEKVSQGKKELEVEKDLLTFINNHFSAEERPILSGNSIAQDRKFIDKYFPQLSNRLHYRMLDVTSFKIVLQGFFQKTYEKKGSHRALDDIRESIEELKFYLSFIK